MRRTVLVPDRSSSRTILLFLIWLPIVLFAQVATDSSRLRVMFGPPIKKNRILHTEVFTVRPDIEATATYSDGNNNLCQFEIPSGIAIKQQVEEVLDLVAPVSMRGDRWNEMTQFTGNSGFTNTYYERVLVSQQIFTSSAINKNPGAIVMSKEKRCGWKPDVFDTPPKPDSLLHHKR
jgi:hypothetical protein